MGDIVELLFAIIAGVFWLFGSTFFRKREEDDPYQQPLPSRNKKNGNDRKNDDSEERQRQIREAIRRKIAERRQENEPEPIPAFEPEPRYQEEHNKSFEPGKALSEPTAFIEPTEAEAFSWNIEANTYEQDMEERLQEIEATKRKAEKLRNKVKKITSGDEDTIPSRRSEQDLVLSLGSVKSALKNPKNAQAAIVYREILGKPVGLRRPSENNLNV